LIAEINTCKAFTNLLKKTNQGWGFVGFAISKRVPKSYGLKTLPGFLSLMTSTTKGIARVDVINQDNRA
jgi:hypothetical protein